MYFNPELFSLNHSKAMTQQGFNNCPPGRAGRPDTDSFLLDIAE